MKSFESIQAQRGYYEFNDQKYKRVTSIINGFCPMFLTAWASKLSAEFAVKEQRSWNDLDDQTAIDLIKKTSDRYRDHKASIGTAVHDYIEAWILTDGQPSVEVTAEMRPHVKAFEAFVDKYNPTFELAEASVFSDKYSYAGTLDFIATIDGIGRVIGDWKTGSGLYNSSAFQLTAYRHADFIGLKNDSVKHELPEVDATILVNLTDTGESIVKETPSDDQMFDLFLAGKAISEVLNNRKLMTEVTDQLKVGV